MTDIANAILRLPDHPLVTVGAFLTANPLLDAAGVAEALAELAADRAAVVTQLDGSRVRLERRGPFVCGTPLTNPAPASDAYRPGYLLMLARQYPAAHVPGGDWAAWLADVPVAALEQAVLAPGRGLAILFAAVGQVRAARVDPLQNLFEADAAQVARGPFADLILKAWATCTLMREHIAAGRPRSAIAVIRAFDRLAGAELVHVPARLVDQLGRLAREAEDAQAHDRAHEVA